MAELHRICFEDSWNEKNFHQLLDNELNYGFTAIEDRCMGFILLQRVLDEAEIFTFCVEPVNRGRGIGRRLLEESIAESRVLKIKRIFLEVAESNDRAYALYSRTGFKTVGCRTDYYGFGKHAVVKELVL